MTWQLPLNKLFVPFRRNKVYASWTLCKTPISVNRGSHFQVRFVWQVWDGQLSPSFQYKVLKLLEGGNATGVRQSSMLGFYRGTGVQKNKPTMFTVGSSTSATFVVPVYIYIHTSNHMYVYVYVNVYVFACVYIYIHTHPVNPHYWFKSKMVHCSQGSGRSRGSVFAGALEVLPWARTGNKDLRHL